MQPKPAHTCLVNVTRNCKRKPEHCGTQTLCCCLQILHLYTKSRIDFTVYFLYAKGRSVWFAFVITANKKVAESVYRETSTFSVIQKSFVHPQSFRTSKEGFCLRCFIFFLIFVNPLSANTRLYCKQQQWATNLALWRTWGRHHRRTCNVLNTTDYYKPTKKVILYLP